MNFAQNLKNIRESKNMSRTEFSKFLDIPYSTYNGYEGQGKEPKYNNLVKIAEKLDVSLDELLDVKLPSKTNDSKKKRIACKDDVQVVSCKVSNVYPDQLMVVIELKGDDINGLSNV